MVHYSYCMGVGLLVLVAIELSEFVVLVTVIVAIIAIDSCS
jgi:hypothetical protein